MVKSKIISKFHHGVNQIIMEGIHGMSHKNIKACNSQHPLGNRRKKKRKRKMMEQALPIYDVAYDESVDTSGDISSLTAEQYMAYVRRQASSIPAIVRASHVDASIFRSNQAAASSSSSSTSMKYMSPSVEVYRCPEEFQPDPAWENETLHAFSEKRSKISMLAQDPRNRERKVGVPKLKDEESWHEFCFRSELPPAFRSASSTSTFEASSATSSYNMSDGEDNGANNDDNSDDIDCEFDGDVDDEASQVSEEMMSGGRRGGGAAGAAGSVLAPWTGPFDVEPSISLLLQFDQVMCQRLLSYQILWLENFPITHNRAQWLFALLAYLCKPLHRDMESDVRQLHRIASNQLAALLDRRHQETLYQDSTVFHEYIKAELGILNTLILITGCYFGQSEYYRRYQDKEDMPAAAEGGQKSVARFHEEDDEGGDVEEDYDDYEDDGEEMNLESCRSKRPMEESEGETDNNSKKSSK